MTDGADFSWTVAELPAAMVGHPQDALGAIRSHQREGEMLQAFDRRAVAGPRHLESAYAHARRATSVGRGRVRDPGALTALYLAGTDQLERAIRRVGLDGETREVVLVAAPARDLRTLLAALGWPPAKEPLPEAPSESTLERLGIERPRYAGRPASERESLVLEHVAMVDFALR